MSRFSTINGVETMPAAKAKKTATRKHSTKARAPRIIQSPGSWDVTPLGPERDLTRAYVFEHLTVKIRLEEGADHCDGSGEGCAQCRPLARQRKAGIDIPRHATRNIDRLYVGLYVDDDPHSQEEAFEGAITTASFHRLVDALVLTRDRMVADGALRPNGGTK